MNKVISINLNGNSYQLDEDAYAELLAYLDRAQAGLRDNPDKAEIIADIEQAIAEKCARVLGPGKTVVLKAEVDQIIKEMGPVVGGEASGDAQGTEPRGSKDTGKAESGAPKRLYRLREGEMVGGVCNGLAAYFHVDVTIVRILFVVATFLTSGVMIPVYFVMMLVIPEATTSDEHAAAHGLPFSAQDIVDRATRFAKGHQAWRRQWRRKQRRLRRKWRTSLDDDRWRADDIPGALLAALAVPVFMMINLALLVVLWFAIHSLATTGGISGLMIPPGMPFWVAVLIVVVIFGIVTSPLSAVRHISYRAYGHYPVFAILSGLAWLAVVASLIWFGSQHQTEVRDFVDRLPVMWQEIWTRFQQR